MLDLGSPVHLATSPRDSSDNPVDSAGLVLVVGLPDGTSTSNLTPTHDGPGEYSYDYTTAQAGRHTVRWAGTGWKYTDTFDVWPTDPRFLINLEDARAALRTEFTGDDDDLRLYIAAVTPVIEDMTGPIIVTQKVRTFDGNTKAVLLDGPVLTATVTVKENGTTLTDVTINELAGIIYAGTSLAPRPFFPGRQNIEVTYKVGDADTPPNVILAAREELRILWQNTQQAQGVGPGVDPDDVVYTPSGFATSRQVWQLCASLPRYPGFA